MPYDPSFLPETGLPGLDIDFSMFDAEPDESSSQQTVTIWSKSPTISQTSTSQAGSIHLELPSDDIMRDMGALESDVHCSAQKRSVLGSKLAGDEEGVLLQPDFEFDEDGNIVELDVTRLSPQRREQYDLGSRDREKSVIEKMRDDMEGISLVYQVCFDFLWISTRY